MADFTSSSLSPEQLGCRPSRVWGEPLGGVSSGFQRRVATVRVFRRYHKTGGHAQPHWSSKLTGSFF